MRKMITALLLVAMMLSVVSVMSGCRNKLRTHTEETRTEVSDQRIIVE